MAHQGRGVHQGTMEGVGSREVAAGVSSLALRQLLHHARCASPGAKLDRNQVLLLSSAIAEVAIAVHGTLQEYLVR